METFEQYGIQIPYRRVSGNVKCVCPNCQKEGKRKHLNDRSLSVNISEGMWKCHYCGWSGRLKDNDRKPVSDAPRKEYRRPQANQLTELHRSVVEWFNGRGISERTLEKARVGCGTHRMPQTGKEHLTIQFNYFLNGELINIKHRTREKHFTLEAGAELIPYNIDSIADSKTCIITEGEMDCLSFIEAGFNNCVSVPNGGGAKSNYLDDFIEGWFDDKDIIYIASDTDTKGVELREELVRRFGYEKCKIVTYGDDCKDANEHLMRYGKESLERCLRTAADVKVDGVFTLKDYEPNLDLIYKEGLKKGFVVGHPNLDTAVSFETKRVCVVTGIPSSGKSEFIDEMCVRLNILYGFKVGFFSPENMPMEYHAIKIVEKLSGKKFQQDNGRGDTLPVDEYREVKDYILDNFFHILPEDGYTIGHILDKAKYLVRKHGIKLLVIDPFNRIMNEQDSHETETQYIARVLNSLTTFAQQQDVLVFLMAHPRKMNDDKNKITVPNLYSINGSSNFYNMCDFGIIVHRYYDPDYTLVRVDKVKFRHLGAGGECKFKFNLTNGRFVPVDNENDSAIYDNTNYVKHGIPPAPQNNGFPTKQQVVYSTGSPFASYGVDNPFAESYASPFDNDEVVPF